MDEEVKNSEEIKEDAVESEEKEEKKEEKSEEKEEKKDTGGQQTGFNRGRYGPNRNRAPGSPGTDFRQRRSYFRKKVCKLCMKKVKTVDYKEVELLRKFITDRGKILPRRITGTCAKHQRVLSSAIMRARMMALLPFVSK